ncbi:ABC transporter substrate-binding protein [Amycolatopsis endophytica]|uniref:Alpha-glucoside transport system substrate-binding protein n=1 Tax=Amycolatopsis endophytica TaxID=860233 RepID=A0A853BCS9_9PSEU|nr:ABC transporter substrate-binding protein [Amycolatopsis endophytica]NYI92471.1 alpha-glucoside transport system substrate-binding protein [Amycolatopsis endophytica]
MRNLFGALILLAACLAGCGPTSGAGTITVLASWTGAEGAAFEQVLAGFTAQTGVRVHYQGTRAVSQVLASDVQNGNPPDIAVVPNPGELVTYVRSHNLYSLDDVLGAPPAQIYGPQWLQLQVAGQAHLYGVAVKVDLKSIVWFNPLLHGLTQPGTWDEFTTATAGQPWCLGLSAPPVSGWPGTDWVEDILLHQVGTNVYRQWAAGQLAWTSPAVRRAWETWGAMMARTVGDNPARLLLTDFRDAHQGMVDDPQRCAYEHNGSFMLAQYPEAGRKLDFVAVPPAGPDVAPGTYEVSADLAGMFTDTPASRALIRYLASPAAQEIWPRASGGGAFSATRAVDLRVYDGNPTARKVAETLRSGSTLCFDASDLMPATMTNAFYRAALEYLDDPDHLTTLLEQLDMIRLGVPPQEWLSVPCGR